MLTDPQWMALNAFRVVSCSMVRVRSAECSPLSPTALKTAGFYRS